MDGMGRSVLVTGTSSGIGEDVTGHLSARGFHVYATVRRLEDFRFTGAPDVEPLVLDVRDPSAVAAAREAVGSRGRGLYGLVNNAGVGGLGPLAAWTCDEMREIFETNVFGMHRMTSAFLDLLIGSQGRIVNIGSQGGIITGRYYGPYTMTKHAVEAYTRTLDAELAPYGVRASVVQPGGIVTNVGRNARRGTLDRFARIGPPFREEADAVLEGFRNPRPPDAAEESETSRKPSPPDIVSVAVYEALTSDRPGRRYMVGTRWEGDRVIDALIESLLEENDNPVHGYSRDELVARLDRHIALRGAGG
jgi:NAD(P)-dependent dehydrogenase (short-subunit alcohol dehydrogenase family)